MNFAASAEMVRLRKSLRSCARSTLLIAFLVCWLMKGDALTAVES